MRQYEAKPQVLPAHAGMILPDGAMVRVELGAPRTCGDDP